MNLTAALSILKSKFFWGALASLVGVVMFYNWAVSFGDSRASVRYGDTIRILKAENTNLKGRVQEMELMAELRESAYKTALLYLTESTSKELNRLSTELNRSESNRKRLEKDLEKARKNLVTEKADAGCTITAGFVRLHDLAASGDQDAASEAASVPGSGPSDVDAPTPVKLSEVSRVVSDNYLECHTRGRLLEEWVNWYQSSKQSWDASVRLQEAPTSD